MANNLASITLRAARSTYLNSIRNNGVEHSVRSMSSSTIPPLPETIKSAQDNFQTADEMPVHRKGGSFDNILYRFTMGLCVMSLGLIGMNILTMANKK